MLLVKIVSLLLVLSIAGPFGAYFLRGRKGGKAMLRVNVVTFFAILVGATAFMLTGGASAEGEAAVSAVIGAPDGNGGLLYIAAALVTGLACIGAGIAVAAAASSAIGAISENEKAMGKALIFVALAEGIALYGLLISFMILGKV